MQDLVSAGSLIAPIPTFYAGAYGKVTFTQLYEHPEDFGSSKICVEGYLIPDPGWTDGYIGPALYEKRVVPRESLRESTPMIVFDTVYHARLRKLLNKRVRVFGWYFVSQADSQITKQWYCITRIDRVEILNGK